MGFSLTPRASNRHLHDSLFRPTKILLSPTFIRGVGDSSWLQFHHFHFFFTHTHILSLSLSDTNSSSPRNPPPRLFRHIFHDFRKTKILIIYLTFLYVGYIIPSYKSLFLPILSRRYSIESLMSIFANLHFQM